MEVDGLMSKGHVSIEATAVLLWHEERGVVVSSLKVSLTGSLESTSSLKAPSLPSGASTLVNNSNLPPNESFEPADCGFCKGFQVFMNSRKKKIFLMKVYYLFCNFINVSK